MAPARPRAPIEDAKGDAKDRTSTAAAGSATTSTRPRKTGTASTVNPAGVNPPKDSASTASSAVPAASTRAANGQHAQGAAATGLTWSAESPALLHAYRNAHGLSAPPAFRSSLGAAVLNMPGVGRHSPTMSRTRDGRKVPKDQLALAVRKHFNGLAVTETDVVVEFLYAIRTQDRGFKMRFAPRRQRG